MALHGPVDKNKLRLDRYLEQTRRILKFHAKRPQNISLYGNVNTFTDDVKGFHKGVFRSYKEFQKEAKTKVYTKPDLGRFGYLYRRTEIAMRNFKKLLYFLSDLVDVKPNDFYSKNTGMETCGDEIIRYINRI